MSQRALDIFSAAVGCAATCLLFLPRSDELVALDLRASMVRTGLAARSRGAGNY
jgi:hypothetical protein